MARARRAQLGAQARPTLNSTTYDPSGTGTGTFTGTRLVPRHALIGVGFALVAIGCGTRHPEAPRGAHPPNAAVVVPYPPPPAKVEEVPAQPAPACVWADGYWDFTDRWEWQAGEWVVPAAHCRLAPVELRRQQGQLWYARPRWYPDNISLLGPQSACPRPPACPSAGPTNGAGGGSGE